MEEDFVSKDRNNEVDFTRHSYMFKDLTFLIFLFLKLEKKEGVFTHDT